MLRLFINILFKLKILKRKSLADSFNDCCAVWGLDEHEKAIGTHDIDLIKYKTSK